MRFSRPATVPQAATLGGRYRAGGTDLQTQAPAAGGLVDLGGVAGLDEIAATEDGGLRIGAMVTLDQLSRSGLVQERAGALALTAGQIATPQIRAAGTVGGNLLQHTRCPYARHELVACYRSGGRGCPAREGVHDRHVVFDLGPCVAPHPSSLAVAFLAYRAYVEVHGAPPLAIAELYGDGSDPASDHRLDPARLVTAVVVASPWPGERAGYRRTTARRRAEWPLVEAVARLRLSGDLVTDAAVAVGGVAPVPLRLRAVERRLAGRILGAGVIAEAAGAAATGADPLPGTRFKVALLRATVRDLLEGLGGGPAG